MSHTGDIAHHLLREIANAQLLGTNGGGIRVAPVARVIGVALGAIHVGIHLVARHESEQVFSDGSSVRHSVVALDDAAVLHVGPVIDGDTIKVAGATVEHLLQRCQATEHSIGVLAHYSHLRYTTLSTKVENVAVEFWLAENATIKLCRRNVLIGNSMRAINAQHQG